MRMRKMVAMALLLTASVWAKPELKWRWSEPGMEILEAVPSRKGTGALITRKFHWPDGHEAEAVAETELEALRARAKKEPRFADPQIGLLGQGLAPRWLDWGWNPAFSPREDRLAYSHQQRPLTGLRTLADTLAGNSIDEWVLTSGKRRTLARPKSGFFADPVYSPDGKRLLFSHQDAVNGAYAGKVGAGMVDMKSGQLRTLLAPAKAKDAWVLVDPFWCGGQARALAGWPLTGGSSMADSYRWDLVDLDHGGRKLVTLASGDVSEKPEMVASVTGKLYLVGGQVRQLDPLSGKTLRAFKMAGSGRLSPDASMRVEGRGRELVLTPADGSAVSKLTTPADIASLTWSADGRFLAVICTYNQGDRFFKDELLIYRVG